jgi:hypothetical protein
VSAEDHKGDEFSDKYIASDGTPASHTSRAVENSLSCRVRWLIYLALRQAQYQRAILRGLVTCDVSREIQPRATRRPAKVVSVLSVLVPKAHRRWLLRTLWSDHLRGHSNYLPTRFESTF